MTFAVADNAKVMVHGKAGSLTDLKAGDSVISAAAERVHHADLALSEVDTIPRHHGYVMCECRCRDETVLDRHRPAPHAEVGEELCPSQSCGRFPRKAVNAPNAIIEPSFKAGAAFSARQQEGTELDLTEDDRIDGDLALVASQPLDDAGMRSGLGGLAQNVRVNEVGHRVSVDSDSIETKKPFSGQAKSQSTRPSFGFGVRRISRYSPGSTRSTSNSSPGSMWSNCRISAGRTICPLLET